MPQTALQSIHTDPEGGGRAPLVVPYAEGAPSAMVTKPAPATLLIESGSNSNLWQDAGVLTWQTVKRQFDGSDTVATLAAPGVNVADPAQYDLGDLVDALDDDRRIRIVRQTGSTSKRTVFQGYPELDSLRWGPGKQNFTVTVLDEGQSLLRNRPEAMVKGRKMRFFPQAVWETAAPDAVELTGLPAVFNAGGRPNRSAAAYEFTDHYTGGTLRLHLFTVDGDPAAEWWSLADALRYLAYHYIDDAPYQVSAGALLADTHCLVGEAPRPASRDPLVRGLTVRLNDVSIQSMHAEEGLAVLCQAGRLHFHVPASTTSSGGYYPYVRVVGVIERYGDGRPETIMPATRRMGLPNNWTIPRQPPRSVDPATLVTPGRVRFAAERNAAQTAQLMRDRRTVNWPTFLAGHKLYEATFLLRPGWGPVPQLDEVDQTASTDGIDDAGAYWDEQFYPEYDADTRVPTSVWHALHPQHHTATALGVERPPPGGEGPPAQTPVRVADVFRTWIFPDDPGIDAAALARLEHQWAVKYGEAAYAVYQPGAGAPSALRYVDPTWGAGLPPSIVQGWVPRRRPFTNRISRESPTTTDLSPMIDFHFGVRAGDDYTKEVPLPSDPGWVRYSGAVEIAADRAAIRLVEANIWNSTPFLADPGDPDGMNAMRAHIEGHFFVRVTACILGDERLSYAAGPIVGGTRTRAKTLDLGYEGYGVRDRLSGNSVLGSRVETDPAYDQRDDTGELTAYAERQRGTLAAERWAGDFETFYFEDKYNLGDSFGACVGLGLDFVEYPWVTAITHINAGGSLRTRVVLTDKRANPELDDE